jgi:hypothetical protein
MDISPIKAKSLRKIEEPSSRRIEVAVLTLKAQFNGYILCQSHQRLLDVLNSGSNSDNAFGSDFLEIRDVDVLGLESQHPTRHLGIGYASRSNIVFVGERKCINSCRLELLYATREKKPILAEIELSSMLLKGSLYAELWQDLTGALNRNERFLPLTDVTLGHSLVDGTDKFEFVAVNRANIIFIGPV